MNVKELEIRDNKYVLPLNEPFKFGPDREVKELLLEKPKAKHIKSLPANPKMEDNLKVISALVGESYSFVDELSIPDMMRCMEFLGFFVPDGQ